MSFDWEDYLHLASELSQQSSNGTFEEAKKRAAISRAYYAAFIKARNKIFPKAGKPPRYYRGGSHNYYIEYYLDEGHIGREVQNKLQSLKRRRKKADYDNSISGLARELAAALQESKKVIERLNQITI